MRQRQSGMLSSLPGMAGKHVAFAWKQSVVVDPFAVPSFHTACHVDGAPICLGGLNRCQVFFLGFLKPSILFVSPARAHRGDTQAARACVGHLVPVQLDGLVHDQAQVICMHRHSCLAHVSGFSELPDPAVRVPTRGSCSVAAVRMPEPARAVMAGRVTTQFLGFGVWGLGVTSVCVCVCEGCWPLPRQLSPARAAGGCQWIEEAQTGCGSGQAAGVLHAVHGYQCRSQS